MKLILLCYVNIKLRSYGPGIKVLEMKAFELYTSFPTYGSCAFNLITNQPCMQKYKNKLQYHKEA